MNKQRRNDLKSVMKDLNEQKEEITGVIDSLDMSMTDVEMAADDEQWSFDNLPEGLQSSERGEQLEENASDLQDVVSDIDILKDVLTGACERIDNINEKIEEIIKR